MKVLINPERPNGAMIIGFKCNNQRLDLPPGEKTEPLDDVFANEALKTFGFLAVDSYYDDPKKIDENENIEKKEDEVGTPLEGLSGIGTLLLGKLEKHEIKTREKFFRLIEEDPEYIKGIIGPKMFGKFNNK